MKSFSVIFISALLILCSINSKLRLKTKANKLSFKQNYIVGTWNAESITCDGAGQNKEISINIEGTDFVGRNTATGENACAPNNGELFRIKLPKAFDNKSTYSGKFQKTSRSLYDINLFVKDIDTVTTNQGWVLRRKVPGSKSLYNSMCDRNYFVGTWSCSG